MYCNIHNLFYNPFVIRKYLQIQIQNDDSLLF